MLKNHSAASLVNTFINYSISIGLGIAGTVEQQTNSGGHTPSQILKGFRSAFYLGIGFSGLAILLAVVNWSISHKEERRSQKSEKDEKRRESMEGGDSA
jgi:hypothetical protein